MKTAPRTANNAVVTRLPAMPGIPYEVKNCITSWPDAKPEPIRVPTSVPANWNTFAGRT